MTTTRLPPTTSAPTLAASSRSRVLVGVAIAVALVLGGLAGWLLRGSPDASAVLAGGGEMTQRQEQIADFLADYEKAWQDGDAQAILDMFAPTGTYTALGSTYRVDDGSLAEFLETNRFPELDVLEPWLLSGDEAVTFHRVNMGTYTDRLLLTGDGELLVVSHTID